MTLKGFGDLRRKTRRMKRQLDKKPKQEVRRGMRRVRHEQKAALVANDAVATTNLFRSFKHREAVTPDGWQYRHENDAAYAGFVEHGTGPKGNGTYPAPDYSKRLLAGLKEWAFYKPGVNVKVYDEWAKSAARTISTVGTAPQPFFWPAWEQRKKFIIGNIRMEVRDAVKRT